MSPFATATIEGASDPAPEPPPENPPPIPPPDCVLWDDFGRTLSPSTWGTASNGIAYSYLGNNPTFVPLSVNGSEGKMHLDGNTFPEVYFGPNGASGGSDAGPWSQWYEWTFQCKFKTPNYTYLGSDGYYVFRFETNERHIFIVPGSNVGFSQPHGYIQNDDGGSADFDWHPSTWYFIKWYYNLLTGDNWVKVWADGDPEPGWLVTNSTYGGAGGDLAPKELDIAVWNLPFGISSNPVDVYWDDFQFCPNPASQPVLDDFGRVVGSGWGTASSGFAWSGTTGLSVSAGTGLLAVGTSTSSFNQVDSPVLSGITAGNRTLRALVRFSAVTGNSGNPNNYQTLAFIKDVSTGVYVEVVVRTNGPNAGPLLNIFDGDGVVTSAAVSLFASTWYWIVFEMNAVSGHYGARIFQANNSDPGGWQVQRSTTPFTPTAPQLRINAFWDGTGNRTTTFDLIDIYPS